MTTISFEGNSLKFVIRTQSPAIIVVLVLEIFMRISPLKTNP